MKKIVLTFLMVLIALSLSGCKDRSNDTYHEYDLFKNGLLGVEKDGQWGYIDKNGEVIIDFLYDQASAFYNGYAIVMNDNEFFLIDTSGKSVLEDKYETLYVDIETGLLIYKKNDQWGLMTVEDEVITDALYDEIDIFSDGLARVESNDKIGYINTLGETVIPITYDNGRNFSEGYVVVRNDDLYGLMDVNGNFVIDFMYDYMLDVDEYGHLIAKTYVDYEPDEVYLLDLEGHIVLEGQSIKRAGDLYAVEDDSETWYLYKADGTKFIDDAFTYVWGSSGYQINVEHVNNDDEDVDQNIWFNEDGTVFQEASYDNSNFGWIPDFFFDNEYFVVEDGDYLDIYTLDDHIRLEADEFSQFLPDDLYLIARNDQYGVVDRDGNVEVEFLYDQLICLNDGFYIYSINDLYGVMDENFEIIATATYDDFSIFPYTIF
jgi:hypothetical protein